MSFNYLQALTFTCDVCYIARAKAEVIMLQDPVLKSGRSVSLWPVCRGEAQFYLLLSIVKSFVIALILLASYKNMPSSLENTVNTYLGPEVITQVYSPSQRWPSRGT